MVIDNEILDSLTAQAKASPRLRMNLNFHQSLDEKCHRFLCCVAGYVSSPTTTTAPSLETWSSTHRKAATA